MYDIGSDCTNSQSVGLGRLVSQSVGGSESVGDRQSVGGLWSVYTRPVGLSQVGGQSPDL